MQQAEHTRTGALQTPARPAGNQPEMRISASDSSSGQPETAETCRKERKPSTTAELITLELERDRCWSHTGPPRSAAERELSSRIALLLAYDGVLQGRSSSCCVSCSMWRRGGWHRSGSVLGKGAVLPTGIPPRRDHARHVADACVHCITRRCQHRR